MRPHERTPECITIPQNYRLKTELEIENSTVIALTRLPIDNRGSQSEPEIVSPVRTALTFANTEVCSPANLAVYLLRIPCRSDVDIQKGWMQVPTSHTIPTARNIRMNTFKLNKAQRTLCRVQIIEGKDRPVNQAGGPTRQHS